MTKKKKQLWGKSKIFVADRRRKGHIQCSRSKSWRSGSGDGILGLEFDQLQKLWRTEGILW